MPLDLEAVARAVKQVESSGGKDRRARYEPGFERRYGSRWLAQGDTAFRRAMLQQFGPKAVYASHGPYQILYPVAVELGFRGTPAQLADETVNRQYFDKKFQRDYQATGGNLRRTLLRYNGGGDPTYPDRVLKWLTPAPPRPQPGGSMPTLDQMKLDGPEVHEKIVQQLHRIDQNVQAMGLGSMSPEDLRSAYQKIKTGVVQVVSQQGQASRTAPTPMSAPAQQPAPGPMGGMEPGMGANDPRNRLGMR